MPSPNVFISHTTQDPRDLSRAHELAHALEDLGAKVWIAPDSIPAGAAWEEQIVRGILDQCNYFLVLLTPASSQSEWVLREVKMAQGRRSSSSGFTVLPLFVGQVHDCEEVRFLRTLQAIAWREKLPEQVYLVATALGISAPPVPLTDAAKAVEFLDREKQREQQSVKPLRRLRTIAPFIGLAAYPVTLLLPETKAIADAFLAGGPLISGAIGWAVTLRQIKQSTWLCRRLDTMKDGLNLCSSATSPACERLWSDFWQYTEESAGLHESSKKP